MYNYIKNYINLDYNYKYNLFLKNDINETLTIYINIILKNIIKEIDFRILNTLFLLESLLGVKVYIKKIIFINKKQKKLKSQTKIYYYVFLNKFYCYETLIYLNFYFFIFYKKYINYALHKLNKKIYLFYKLNKWLQNNFYYTKNDILYIFICFSLFKLNFYKSSKSFFILND